MNRPVRIIDGIPQIERVFVVEAANEQEAILKAIILKEEINAQAF